MAQPTSNAKEISLGKDFGDVAVHVNGITVQVSSDGKNVKIISDTPLKTSVSAPPAPPPIVPPGQALRVGDHLQDGTVVIAVDWKNNEALFAPENIFGGEAEFEKQDDVVAQANAQSLHGRNDWRRVTDKEAGTLAQAWKQVAPPALQGNYAPWFWGKSPYYESGRIYKDGTDWNGGYLNDIRPVPVVRSGPPRS